MNVSSKLRRRCKIIKAASWIDCLAHTGHISLLFATKAPISQRIGLDCYSRTAYIYLRTKSPGCRIVDQARCQSGTSQSARSPQPTPAAGSRTLRSEEHTSELQSLR